MRRTFAGFEPLCDEDRHALRHIKVGEYCKVRVTKPRNLAQHRLYWALCDLVAQNHPEIQDRETASGVIKLEAGWVETVKSQDGKIYFLPKSISFSSMDQVQFQEYMDRATMIVAELLEVPVNTLQQELARRMT